MVIFDNLGRQGVERNLDFLCETHGEFGAEWKLEDVRDAEALAAAAAGTSAVFHLAAQVAVTGSLLSPMDDFEVNARGTLNLLEALRMQAKPVAGVFHLHQQSVRQSGRHGFPGARGAL